MAAYRQVVEELDKPARRRYPRWKLAMRRIDETYQIDLVHMKAYSNVNRCFKYLTAIDVFYKFAWVIGLKDKSGPEVAKAISLILTEEKYCRILQTDDGTEFYNSHVFKLLKKYNIHL